MYRYIRLMPNKYPKILVLSDLHSNLGALREALIYARFNDCFTIMVGDLLDSEIFIDDTENVIELLYGQYMRGKLISCMGNHDFKYVRTMKVGSPILSDLQHNTMDILTNGGQSDTMIRRYLRLLKGYGSKFYTYACDIGNVSIAHAAVTNSVIRQSSKSTDISKFLYGESNNEIGSDGYPIRTYDWVDTAESDITIVGHDRIALGKDVTDMLIHTNALNNKVIFTDCSSGKQPDGLLGGVELHLSDDGYTYEVVGEMKFG